MAYRGTRHHGTARLVQRFPFFVHSFHFSFLADSPSVERLDSVLFGDHW